MKKLLNTLFITSNGTYLSRDGDTIVISREKENLLRVPIHTLDGIVLLANSSLSTPFMGFCAEHGVQISMLSEYGEFHARVQGPVKGNVLLRREQYRAASNPDRAASASFSFVAAKIANCRTVLLRAMRDRHDLRSALEPVTDSLGRSLETLQARHSIGRLAVDSIRGNEGDCAREYFGAFDALITTNKNEFRFAGRSRRPRECDAVIRVYTPSPRHRRGSGNGRP